MKKRLTSVLLALCLALTLLPGTALAADTTGDAISEQAWEVLRLTNRHRMAMGLEPLSTFSGLQKVADQRAAEIVVSFSHTRPDGSSCFTAYEEYGVSYNSAAENIAAGQTTAAQVMESWLNSSGHRANIESSTVTHLGVGYVSGSSGYRTYWAQNFVGSNRCAFSDLRLSKTDISAAAGTDLETLLTDADIVVTATCAVHGECRLPLIAAMCTGYDPSYTGTQNVTVQYGGGTAALTVRTSDAPFTDVQDSAFYAPAVAWAVEQGITSGTGGNAFSPLRTCTRAEIVTFLYRAAGQPAVDVSKATAFSDVKATDFYAKAVAWAVEKGITSGTGDGKFSPLSPCSRAEIVTFLWRYAGKPAVSASATFTDVADGAFYAAAVDWAVGKKITSGTGNGAFSPLRTCTRAEAVTFLYRDLA